jgi:hypothetical protein
MNKRPWQTLCWHRAKLISLASPPASAVSISIATAVTLPVTRGARAPHPPRGRNVTVASRQFSRSPGFRHCRSAAASLRDRRLCRLTVGTGASSPGRLVQQPPGDIAVPWNRVGSCREQPAAATFGR